MNTRKKLLYTQVYKNYINDLFKDNNSYYKTLFSQYFEAIPPIPC